MVGQLYAAGDNRRDAGFSIFYMGINLGAFLSPLVCGWLGQKINWHLGFGVAALGMMLGLIQYVAGGSIWVRPACSPSRRADSRGRRRSRRAGCGWVWRCSALWQHRWWCWT